MNNKIIYALVLIALVVVILLVNRDSMSVNLLVGHVKSPAPFVFLSFTSIGVAIGMLLK